MTIVQALAPNSLKLTYAWNYQSKLGKVFSSSTIVKLPLGSQRSPDTAWVELSSWNVLSAEDQAKFPSIAPDFVIELRSRTDIVPLWCKLSDLQNKMVEYQDNGVRLGLLINPQDRQVEMYTMLSPCGTGVQGRLGQDVELLESSMSVDCSDVMPGFTLDLTEIW
jgi:Uma2 family endonuclease